MVGQKGRILNSTIFSDGILGGSQPPESVIFEGSEAI